MLTVGGPEHRTVWLATPCRPGKMGRRSPGGARCRRVGPDRDLCRARRGADRDACSRRCSLNVSVRSSWSTRRRATSRRTTIRSECRRPGLMRSWRRWVHCGGPRSSSPSSTRRCADDAEFVRAHARRLRAAATPRNAAAQLRYILENVDVRSVLPLIQAPTLVLHASHNPLVRVDHGRYLADHIPGAKFVEVPGHGIAFDDAANLRWSSRRSQSS